MSRSFVASVFLFSLASAVAGAPPAFKARVVDDKIGVGYGLAIGDVDGDGKDDILLADAREIVWYRNPDWKKHRITGSLTPRDHVCIAARDLDGDGRVEVAVGAQWNPGETVNEAESGAVFYLARPKADAPPETPWTPVRLPHDPTVHRMRWVKNGEGRPALVVLPLHGRGNRNGAGENGVRVRAFTFPENPLDPAAWKSVTLDDSLRVTHNFDDRPAGPDGAEEMIVGGREGFLLAEPDGAGWRVSKPSLTDAPGTTVPFQGIGEIRYLSPAGAGGGRSTIAAIEPFHGPHLAVYEYDGGTRGWTRRVIDSSMNQGHALACGDLLKRGYPQIVAGWREPNAAGAFGIRLFLKDEASGAWTGHWIADGNTMACEDLKLADLDGDGREDIVAAGRSTKNVVIYWNRPAGAEK